MLPVLPTTCSLSRRIKAIASMDSRVLRNKLEEHFGFTKFRPGQVQAVASTMRGRDTVVIMPTGSGKSLCYQLPALELKGVTVVVGPLIALANDQATRLRELDIKAVVLNSSCRAAEIHKAHDGIKDGSIEFVFTTPERLQGTDLCEVLRSRGVDILVIDEAHCVSQWGHDFRPDYLSLHWIRAQLDNPPVLALTATATEDTLADIERALRLEDPEIICTGINRENINLSVINCEAGTSKLSYLSTLLANDDGQAICYVATTKLAEELSEMLSRTGINSSYYHGKMRKADRDVAQDAFMSNKARVMFATNAFGLGIDKPDVRQVIHYHLPGSVESYYQEFGRSGRDGLPARCTLLYAREDRNLQKLFARSGVLDSTDLINAHHALKQTCEALGSDECELKEVLARSPLKRTKLAICLQMLATTAIVAPIGKSRWRLVKPEVERRQLEWLEVQSRDRRENQEVRLQQMIEYAEGTTCRWHRILDYFSEESVVESACMRCDRCESARAVA